MKFATRSLLAGFLALLAVRAPARAAPAASTPETPLAQRSWEEQHRTEPFVRLLFEKTVTVNADYSYREEFHVVDKIQTEGGKPQGEVKLHYDRERQEYTRIEAVTVLPDGMRVACEQIQDLDAPGNEGVYDDRRVKTLTMSNVVPGSRIDWRATRITRKPVLAGHFYDLFTVSAPSPSWEVRYRVVVPRGVPLRVKALNFEGAPAVEEQVDTVTYTWVAREVDREEFEEAMPPWEERVPAVSVSTLPDWSALSSWAGALYRKNGEPSPEMRKKARELTEGKERLPDKVQAILEYLRRDFRYVAMEIGEHGYEPHPAAETFSHKYGDCKDQTLLAIAMLSEIGVQAWPTLLSTTSDLPRTDLLPMPMYFDHAILSFTLDGKLRHADVLQKGYGIQETPLYLSGKRIFVVDGDGGTFVQVPSVPRAEVNASSEDVELREDGSAVVQVTVTFGRMFSLGIREGLERLGPVERERFFSGMDTVVARGGKVLDRKWTNLEAPYAPLVVQVRYEHPAWAQKVGSMLLFGLPPSQRPAAFSAARRRHPVLFREELGAAAQSRYRLPAGYELVSVPKPVRLERPFATFTREYTVEGDAIRAADKLEFRTVRVAPSEYSEVRDFFDSLPKLTNDKVAIKKKE